MGAALAEVVAAVTTNRAPTKERTTLLISATFLPYDLPTGAGPAAQVSSDHSPCARLCLQRAPSTSRQRIAQNRKLLNATGWLAVCEGLLASNLSAVRIAPVSAGVGDCACRGCGRREVPPWLIIGHGSDLPSPCDQRVQEHSVKPVCTPLWQSSSLVCLLVLFPRLWANQNPWCERSGHQGF